MGVTPTRGDPMPLYNPRIPVFLKQSTMPLYSFDVWSRTLSVSKGCFWMRDFQDFVEITPTRTAEIPAAPPAKKDLIWSIFGGSDIFGKVAFLKK